jgi:hypothetical protein
MDGLLTKEFFDAEMKTAAKRADMIDGVLRRIKQGNIGNEVTVAKKALTSHHLEYSFPICAR